MDVKIRQGKVGDMLEMQQLFVETILEVCKKDYSDKQLKAWVKGVENRERWIKIFQHQQVLVAVTQSKIIGFCTLANGNYLDFLFVHKEFQGKGIANLFFAEIEKEALKRNGHLLTSSVSFTAKPFFEAKGFRIICLQSLEINGISIKNYKMEKLLLKTDIP